MRHLVLLPTTKKARGEEEGMLKKKPQNQLINQLQQKIEVIFI
jgi:hypothetical protein